MKVWIYVVIIIWFFLFCISVYNAYFVYTLVVFNVLHLLVNTILLAIIVHTYAAAGKGQFNAEIVSLCSFVAENIFQHVVYSVVY